AARTLDLPKHAQLREELLNLVVEMTPQGVRVVDKGKIHQDHAVAVRGVVAMLVAASSSRSREISQSWANSDQETLERDFDCGWNSVARRVDDGDGLEDGSRWAALGGLSRRLRTH